MCVLGVVMEDLAKNMTRVRKRRREMIHFILPTIFQFFPTKIIFSPDPPLFFPISVTTALTKTLNYPSTLRGHTLNAAERFMTYPKL